MSVDVDATESGLYVVRWQVIGGDTHPGLGQFTFRVGQNGGVVPATDDSASVEEVAPLGLALQAGSRWLHFIGYALSFGVLAFQILILPAASDTVTINQRIRRLVGLGMLLLLLAEPLALLGQTASLGPGQLVDPAAVSAAFDSSFGRILSLRLGALFLLWVLLGTASAGRRLTTLALGAALAVVDGASAHALSVQPPWLGLAVNAVHLSAAGVWVGGIAALVALWNVSDLAACRRTILDRFSRLAIVAVVTLTIAGALMAWWHLGAPTGDLVAGLATDYGRALGVKVALAIGAFVVAGWAIRWKGSKPRWWIPELVAVVAVMGAAGLVVSLRPPA